MTLARRPVGQRPALSGRILSGSAVKRTVPDRQRTILAALDRHGSPSAAAPHLGITANAIRNAVARAAATLGTDPKGAVEAARAAGLLADAPADLDAAVPAPRAAREEVTRPDGSVWQAPANGSRLMVYPEGLNLLVLRTGDIGKARDMVARRWDALHHAEPPATGQVVWRRQTTASGPSGGAHYEACPADAPRAFPAVLFTPEGA